MGIMAVSTVISVAIIALVVTGFVRFIRGRFKK